MNGLEIGRERPIIGISCDNMVMAGARRHMIRDSYVSAILAAGGAPLLIPCTGDEAASYALYRLLDGLLLTGGGDIDPQLYGEGEAGTEIDGIEPRRDSTELSLARWAVGDDLPLLGICRGHQVLNVALGGTLIQDIPGSLPESTTDHRGSTYTDDRSLLTHQVRFEAGCKLAGVFGETTFSVNSLHHQGVKEIAPGLQAVGFAPDGLIEALENPDRQWVVSVQWHPEELWARQTEAASLFQAFVQAAQVSSDRCKAVGV